MNINKILRTLLTVLLAVVAATLVRTFIVQLYYIPSSSMEPTLNIEDRVLVFKNELFDHGPLLGESSFNITKLSVGVDHAFQSGQGFEKSIGLVGSAFSYPENLNTYYGDSPKSVLMYFKIKI